MAKEEIYTIPVIDAFKEDCECPLCFLYEQLEKDSVDFVLSPSYMEVDVRGGYTNEYGFCRKHFSQLYAEPNRLGVALMLESHMKKVKEDLKTHIKKKALKPKALCLAKKDAASKLGDYTGLLLDSCYICYRVDKTFHRYLDTFFYLWKRDEDFREAVKNSKGFCVNHFGMLYDQGQSSLNKKAFEEFEHIILKIQEDNFDRVIGDIEWFITKFDYRFEKEPWKNSKDAIIRSIRKMSSFDVKD